MAFSKNYSNRGGIPLKIEKERPMKRRKKKKDQIDHQQVARNLTDIPTRTSGLVDHPMWITQRIEAGKPIFQTEWRGNVIREIQHRNLMSMDEMYKAGCPGHFN